MQFSVADYTKALLVNWEGGRSKEKEREINKGTAVCNQHDFHGKRVEKMGPDTCCWGVTLNSVAHVWNFRYL